MDERGCNQFGGILYLCYNGLVKKNERALFPYIATQTSIEGSLHKLSAPMGQREWQDTATPLTMCSAALTESL